MINPRRGQTAIEYVGRPGGKRPPWPALGLAPLLAMINPRRGQTAIEYVMMISATVVFITLVAYFVKNKVVAP